MNTTPILIPRQLAADMAAEAHIEAMRHQENLRAAVAFVVAVAAAAGVLYYLV